MWKPIPLYVDIICFGPKEPSQLWNAFTLVREAHIYGIKTFSPIGCKISQSFSYTDIMFSLCPKGLQDQIDKHPLWDKKN